MSDEPVNDDPLLEFENEPGAPAASPPPTVTPQAAAPEAVVAHVTIEPLRESVATALQARITHLEFALERSSSEVASLKSELATLVSAVDDIKKRLNRRPVIESPAVPRAPVQNRRTGSAVAGLVLGIGIAAAGWSLWPQDTMVKVGVPAVAAPAPLPPAPEPAVTPRTAPDSAVSKPPSSSASAENPGRAPAPRVVPAATRIDYVGTLSIDAAPGGDVFIDRRPAGKTPIKVANLKAGSHLVWIERDGYHRWTRVVEVPADRVTRLWADLETTAR